MLIVFLLRDVCVVSVVACWLTFAGLCSLFANCCLLLFLCVLVGCPLSVAVYCLSFGVRWVSCVECFLMHAVC